MKDKPVPKAIPPEAGKPARIERDGSVHGSGMGAGGGERGEDYSDDAGGSEAPPSGKGAD